ncbi:hypothetical protein GCM10025760_06910 [Microbacterium yannicii]|uniref:WXG100 family type VII secretion target n=1 Tax=Microbacterium yannicii TaxID=671622 RepID=A0ABP9M1P6_9MICO
MDGVQLNLARLLEAGSRLTSVKSEFENASANARGLADAVGHDGLADALIDFADKWDDTRKDMVANIGTLAEASTGIAEAFGQLDSEYANALSGDGAAPPAGGHRPEVL